MESTRGRRGAAQDSTALVASLRSCARSKDLHGGTRVHEEILRYGLLPKCSDALITMYSKCGALEEAQKLFDPHTTRDVVTWTALIGGLAQHGHGHDALTYFHLMQRNGPSPDAITFSCALKACSTIGAADKGEEIHDQIAKHRLLADDIVLGNALVDMYAKCGALTKARGVFEELHLRNIVSWNALITGYAQHGEAVHALDCLEQMLYEGVFPDAVTYNSALKACGCVGAADKGEIIHHEIGKQGLLEKNISLGNALVDMYAKCGDLGKAVCVLEQLISRDSVSWNALMSGYADENKCEQVLECFERMQHEGLCPNAVTFICILKACGSLGVVEEGGRIHARIAKRGPLENNVLVGSALVDMYSKCGALANAQRVFEGLPVRNIISWSALIAGYAQKGESEEALNCFERMQGDGLTPDVVTFTCILKACGSIGATEIGEKIHYEIANQGLLRDDDIFLGTALVDMYVKCGALEKAQQVLKELRTQNITAWNSVIVGYVQQDKGAEALKCFIEMQIDGPLPDVATFMWILKACGSIGAADKIGEIHEGISKKGLLENHVVLGNVLVDAYAKCGALAKAREVLEMLPVRNVSSWTTLMARYVQQEDVSFSKQALTCFERLQHEGLVPDAVAFICALKACGNLRAAQEGEEIHCLIDKHGLLGNSVVLGKALVDMYAKCGALVKAREVHEMLGVWDVHSWNVLISGYVKWGENEQALSCYEAMQHVGLSPDAVTFTCILKACAILGAADKGKDLHDRIAKQGLLKSNMVLGTALVDMYAKCGALAKARRVLDELPTRNAISWNALIAGYTRRNQDIQALNCLERMQLEGLDPDAATFYSVLSAFTHGGLTQAAQMYLASMSTNYGIEPDVKHYTCVAEHIGHAGHLDKAIKLVEKLPASMMGAWAGLLDASCKYGNVTIGRLAFENAIHVS